jgi:PAS domain S-box-containing protein
MEAILLIVASSKKTGTEILRKTGSLGYKSIDLVQEEKEALKALSAKAYTAAIINLEPNNSEAAIRTGRAISLKYHTPLVFLGDQVDDEVQNQVMQIRPWAFLSKPLKDMDLRIAIENIISHHPSAQTHTSDVERRWHNLLNNLPGLAYQCLNDRNWTMLFLSQGCLELTGYDPSDIVLNKRVSYQDLIHPDDREKVRNEIESSYLERFDLTYRIRTKEGKDKWVLERGIKTTQIQKGKAVIEGVIVDIDEQKRSEMRLKLSLSEIEILNSLNTSANEGISIRRIFSKLVRELDRKYGVSTNLYFLDTENNRLIAQNIYIDKKVLQSFEESLGKKIPEITIDLSEGSLHHSIMHGPDHFYTTDQKKIASLAADFHTYSNLKKELAPQNKQIIVKSILLIKLKHKEDAFGLMSLRSDQVLSDEVIQSIITVSDGISNILGRKLTEEKLILEENKFRMLWEKAPSGIIMIDSDAYVRSINRSICRITGFSEAEILNRHIRDLPAIPKKSVPEYLAIFTKLLTRGSSKPFEFQWIHKDGTLNWGEALISQIKKNGNVTGIQAHVNDITQRKQSELKIKESEDLYRTMISKSPMAIIILNDEKISFVNPVFCKLMGVKNSDQLEGVNALEVVAPDYRNIIAKRLENISRGRANSPITLKLNRRDEKEVFIEGSSVPVVISGKKATLVIGRDISEQKVAEEKLRENEKLLSSILQAAPIGIGLVKERVFYWVNDAFVKMVGYSSRELIGQKSELIYPDRKAFKQAGKIKYEQLARESIGKVETRFRCKNGKVIDVLLSSVALDSENITAGTTFTAIDITQRNTSEKILKENEERYRTLFENMAQGVFYQRADGTLLDVNRAALRMLGLTKAKFLGKTSVPAQWIFVNENMEDMPGEKHPARLSLKTGKKQKNVVVGTFNPLLNKFVWLLVNTQPQFRPGETDPYQVFVTLHDMTEIKNAERELNKSYQEIKKLSRRNEEIREEERKQIARNLHDELGQILTAIKMDISWIKNKLPEDEVRLVQRAETTLEIVDQAIGGVQRITSELRPPILDNLGLFEALRSLIFNFQKRTGMKTRIKLPEKEPPMNPDFTISLYRIIQEALTNIIRHSYADQVELSITEKNNTLDIEIKDNGRGIPDDKIHSSESLGLIGIKERVLRWKGEYHITGNAEKGTALQITVPVLELK